LTKNITLYTRYQIKQFTVNYFYESSQIATQTVQYNSAVIAGPAKTGYTFAGWYTAPAGQTGTKVTTITKSQSLFARHTVKKFTVTYYDGATLIQTAKVAYNKAPMAGPTKTGYKFLGWFTSKSGGSQVTVITKSQTLYARYQIRYYDVSYYDGNTLIKEVNVKYNTNVIAGPKKVGYIFKGWYTSKSGGTKITKISKSQTLYARYAKGVILDVPNISQLPELPTGCEITSVTQMVVFAGSKTSKTAMANAMPYHSWNPDLGFVGNPYLWSGWTIYPPALMNLVKQQTGSSKNMTGSTISTLKAQLDKGRPIVVWVGGFYGFGVHALVLTGYEGDYFYYNDCWSGQKNAVMTQSYFLSCWSMIGWRALSY